MAGMVSTVSATKIYVENKKNWDHLYLHVWGGDLSYGEWPGQDTPYEIIDGKKVHTLELGNSTHFIISNGSIQSENVDASGYTDGCYYYIDGDDPANLFTVNTSNMSLLVSEDYSFTTTTVESYDELKIYLFYNDSPIHKKWADAPIMEKNTNEYTYTYTYKSFVSSTAPSTINVIFYNNSGQTDNLDANTGSNSYLLKFNNDQANKFRFVETVTPNARGYATYVNTKPLTIPASTAYYATDNGNGNATAHAITNPDAGTPMLIKGTPSIPLYFEVAESGLDYTSGNAFKQGPGSAVASQDGNNYNYILNGDVFKAANGQSVASNKAYLQLSAPAAARVLVFDDEISGISTTTNNENGNKTYYNLSGQRVTTPMKGLYIQNGKKMIVK